MRTLRKLLNWIVFAVVVVGAVLYVRSLGGEGYDVPSPAEATGKHLAECNAWRQEYERTLAFDLFFKLTACDGFRSLPAPLVKASQPSQSGQCSPSYPGVCIPPAPPDLDCRDIGARSFRVLRPDPHHFDLDGDGVGCEN